MAGSYYYNTPIGHGMNNLANAIASIPARDAQVGLLAARQRLLDEQVRNEAFQRAHLESQTRLRNAEALTHENVNTGRQGIQSEILGNFLRGGGGVGPSFQTPMPAPNYSLAPAMTGPLPSPAAAPPVQAPDSVGSPDMASNVTRAMPMPAGNGIRLPPQQAPAGPPGTGVPGGGTGITPDLSALVAGYSALTGLEPPKIMMMLAGNNLAAQQTTPDLALSMTQSGAGEPYGQTVRGGQATIQERADAAAQQSRDRRYATDTEATTSRVNQTARILGQGDRAAAKPPKPDKPPAPLTTKQLQYTSDQVAQAAVDAGFKITPTQIGQVVGRISARVKAGDDHATAIAEEVDNMVQTAPAHEEPGRFWGTNTVPEKKVFRPPGVLKNRPPDAGADAGPADAVATPAAAAPADAAAPSSKPAGMVERGNIDLNKRPVVKNPDGSVSTVRSMGVNIDGQDVLIPTVSEDGRIMNDAEAIDQYIKTGKHLGKFKDQASSDAYAETLHQDQAKQYAPGGKPAAGGLPPGAKQIGTSGGKPVYQLPNGKRIVQTD